MDGVQISQVVLGREAVNLTNLYPDAMRLLANLLDPWDLVAMSLTCKSWYRFIKRPEFRRRISYPFDEKYKLTPEQFDCLKQLLTTPAVSLQDYLPPQRLVHGTVGAGKTWVATAYFMHKFKDQNIAGLVVVPPTCVQQWSDFFRVYTSLPVLSNYKSSCFYHKDWKKLMPKCQLFITSNITSLGVQKQLMDAKREHVIIHDEAHNAIGAQYVNAIEAIGFTASIETFTSHLKIHIEHWQVFKLKAETLTAGLLPVDFVGYTLSGYTPGQRQLAAATLHGTEKTIDFRSLQMAFSYLTYGDLLSMNFQIRRGTKDLTQGYNWGYTPFIDLETVVRRCLEIPKLRQLVAVAELVQKRGEKLVIFDMNQDAIVLLYTLLTHFGFKVCPFTSKYDPTNRAKLLKEFEQEADVLIGSVEMLSEGHNITCANNIVFARYPSRPEEFMQALGRCHRFPQKKMVHVHMIASCELELNMAMKCLDGGYTQIKRTKHESELAEFRFKLI